MSPSGALPVPELCIKTADARGRKFFVNVLTSEAVESVVAVEDPVDDGDTSPFAEFRHLAVPISLSRIVDTTDAKQRPCGRLDVCVGSDTTERIRADGKFRRFCIEVIFQQIERDRGVQASRKYKILAKRKYFGSISDFDSKTDDIAIHETGDVQIREAGESKTAAPTTATTATTATKQAGAVDSKKVQVIAPSRKEKASQVEKPIVPFAQIAEQPGGTLKATIELPKLDIDQIGQPTVELSDAELRIRCAAYQDCILSLGRTVNRNLATVEARFLRPMRRLVVTVTPPAD
ncbi:MAG: hypothetical protein MHM6MM_006939 [Cercozoa sp. M6MM]